MTLLEKATQIAAQLEALYPNPAIPLDHLDPFTFLCAVMLSAQATDKSVNEASPKLFAAAPTPEKMAALSETEILSYVKTINLAPTKAKNLKRMSELLIERHGGQVPKTFEALEALPGVGHKTASVLMSQAFGLPAFPIDTHIHRLAQRWGLSSGKNVVQTERDLKALFPAEKWNDLHLQIIYFGREHCPALRHNQSLCPICAWAALPTQNVDNTTQKPKKRTTSRAKKTTTKRKTAAPRKTSKKPSVAEVTPTPTRRKKAVG